MIVPGRRALVTSAQQIDPMTWFTGPFVPLVFGTVGLVHGVLFTIGTWRVTPAPWLQIAGVLCCFAACAVVHVLTRPMRPPIGWPGAIVAVALAAFGFVLSSVGYAGVAIPIEVWWGPFGLGLAIASLGPYLPAWKVLVLGVASAAVTIPVAVAAVGPDVTRWGPVAVALIVAGPLVIGIAATAAFSISIVSRTEPLIEARSRAFLAVDPPRSAAVQEAERRRLAQLTARAVPFLEQVAERGVVRASDRSLAGQLARQLRDELVTQSNLTWLDSVAAGSRLVVVDPERRANRMRAPQRAALRGLITAMLELPGADDGSLLIELRGHPDGSTVVGVSMDVELPEGRRIMHLAPYYLALRGSLGDVEWWNDRFLRLTFNLPPGD